MIEKTKDWCYVAPDDILRIGGNAHFVWRFPNAAEGEGEEELGMAVDHEVVPEASEPNDEGEQHEASGGNYSLSTGVFAFLYHFLFGLRADLTPGNAGRIEPKNDFKRQTDKDLGAGKGSC